MKRSRTKPGLRCTSPSRLAIEAPSSKMPRDVQEVRQQQTGARGMRFRRSASFPFSRSGDPG